MFALLIAAVSAPLAGLGSAASSAPTDVHAVVVGSDGQLVAVERDGARHEIGVDASITGRTVDLDDDGVLETPFVGSGGTLRLTEPDGAAVTLARSASASKSAIAVGDLDGDGTPAVFYPNASDSDYVYKVEIGADPGEPTRVTATAANGVAGVGDLDGDDERELGFAGSSSTIKYLDGDAVESTGYSGIGSNNGYGLGGVADVDGDGTPRVSVVTGSNNIALIDDAGNTEKITAVSAAKSPIAAANWTGGEGLELLYLDTNGKLSYTTLDGQHERVLDASGSTIEGTLSAGVAMSPGLAAPRITDYGVTNPAGREIRVSLTADKRLETISVDVAGPDPTTLDRGEFDESGSGPYTYVATYRADTDGNYTATVETAIGPDGNDGARDQQRGVTVRTPNPVVENATITDATDDDGAVGGNDTVAVSAAVPDADRGNVTVVADASAFGAGEVTLAHVQGSTYGANVTVDASAVPADGNQSVTVTATNQYDNDGSATTGSLVVDTTPPDADAGPDVSPTVGTQVTFDGDGSADRTGIERYHWEFGDGTTATGKSVTHVYDEPGTYTVTLSVTDGVGNTATDTLTATVEEAEGAASTETPATSSPPTSGPATPEPTEDDEPTNDGSTGGGDTEPTVVDEAISVETRVDGGIVRVEVSDATAGNAVALSIPSGEVTERSGVALAGMTVRPTRDGAFQVTVDGNVSAPADVTRLNETRAADPLAYWTVDHSIDDEQVAGATLEFTVRQASLDGERPDALTLYRHGGGNWTAYDAQVLGHDGERYRYRVHSPRISTFAVGVRQPNVTVERVTLDDDAVHVGETVTVTAVVENEGSTDATRTLSFRLGDETVANRTVTVPADERRVVSFAAEPTRAGEFDAAVADTVAGRLTVTDPAATRTATATATRTPVRESGGGVGFLLPVLLVLTVAVGLTYYYGTQ